MLGIIATLCVAAIALCITYKVMHSIPRNYAFKLYDNYHDNRGY